MLFEALNNMETFFFVFVRVMAIFLLIPFIGGRSVPMQVKLGIVLVIAMIVTPTIPVTVHMPQSLVGIVVGVLREVLIGVTLGLVVNLVFASFEVAGQLAGIQMGFSMANVIDPQTKGSLSVISQFYNFLGIFLFFTLNIHLVFFAGLKESFTIIPPYGFTLSEGLYDGILQMSFDVFKVGLKLAAPISIAVLLANLGMGIIARTVPQLNIFVVGFPVTITLGLIILAFSLPFLVSTISEVLSGLSGNIMGIVRYSNG